ncbi:HNH endonuclease [Pseudomonas oryzihabitans]|uniref:HNH endonuclease n=1 Tax=Pseudomonas oryzihabitans TaxID=47885 RepID=UPI00289F4905|nr:HNH endonuclease [Pseudomonas oryzihabitans]
MKAIPGLRGYFADEHGQIFSTRTGIAREIKSRIRKGYAVVTLMVDTESGTQRHQLSVHRLVLMAHVGLPDEACKQARHLNGDALDNRAVNLEWGTAKDNARDAVRHGTLGPGLKARHRKLLPSQVSEIIRRRQQGERSVDLAREFGVKPEYIRQLVKGVTWRRALDEGQI